ncbi:speckle-type POZ protein B-like [Orussus abietinus]|uniref:speckle-type POZ protein B-like n=1 Tax=Orussus abietinus TaxID=222816 RepID=UPI000625F8BC|nr:speckle-type POZ protein B-like [Orussus abietinus]
MKATEYVITPTENKKLKWQVLLDYDDTKEAIAVNAKSFGSKRCSKHAQGSYCYETISACKNCNTPGFIYYTFTFSYRSLDGKLEWTKTIDSKNWLKFGEEFRMTLPNVQLMPTKIDSSSDVLTVTSKFYVVEEVNFTCQNREDLFPAPIQHVSTVSKYLWESQKLSDVILIVSEKKFHAHKAILAASSLVFQRMFDSEMREGIQNTVEITEVEHTLVDLMLQFLYLGPIENVQKNAYQLVYLADKYDIEPMKEMCQNVLYRDLIVENCVNTLILADTHNLQLLKSSTICYIAKNIELIINRSEYEKLMGYPILLSEILRENSKVIDNKNGMKSEST